ncbi:MAG: polyphosphate polymerase domain-containing protein [Prevotella sp.]|nr:polyphosphate polymerase domain-containing protein [Prevotella sp.]
MNTDIDRLLKRFAPITLSEMNGVKLMNRTDTKFVTSRQRLTRLLLMACEEYRIVEIDGWRNIPYATTYFDTGDFNMFTTHVTGRLNRQKLRVRSYLSSNLHFLEVKTKDNHRRTKKNRITVDDKNILLPERLAFLHSYLNYDPHELSPSLDNTFNRITLVNGDKTERLTIDTDLHFHNPQTSTWFSDPRLVVVELKRDGKAHSPIQDMLLQLRIHPHGFSKYCMGLSLTSEGLRTNRLKPKIMEIKNILTA